MNRGIESLATGMLATQQAMDVVSNNLANVSTNGFKKSTTDFADVIASSLAADPTKAVGSDGKALAGAALKSFMTKCKKDACEPKAIDKNGKALAGAAKASFLKKCQADA